ncbi:MAG: hypothetical protein Q4F05_15410 [bacterium]|nr:hypothetical protein [bacterium]
MGVRLTGVSTPVGGVSWEFTEKEKNEKIEMLRPDKKINVFISSICGEKKYDDVRKKIKEHIEKTNLANVYIFERKEASSIPAGTHYTYALEDSDVCIFLIDNKDGITPGVQREIDIVKKYNIKAIYYFCDEKTEKKTVLEKSLMGAEYAKSKTIHKFEELIQESALALINDIVSVYHYYCKDKMFFREQNEELQKIHTIKINSVSTTVVPKSVLANVDRCKSYIMKCIMGFENSKHNDEVESTSEIDSWGIEFFDILYKGKSIRQFNLNLFLESIKEQQSEMFKVVSKRWYAIQAYFLGDIKKCIEYLQEALQYAKNSNAELWIIKDILIDLRNQTISLDAINNRITESQAQRELSSSDEEVYYPLLDRFNETLQEKYMEGLLQKKIESPYTIKFGNDLNQYVDLLTSIYIVSLFNGSLTHLILVYEKIKMFLFYLCNKYDDWNFRRDLLKLSIFGGKEKEVKGIKSAYPEILNNLSENDASEIMSFCNNEPILYKKNRIIMLGLATVGYYLSDAEFEKNKTKAIDIIRKWMHEESPVIAMGDYIFVFLTECSFRISQDELCDICCLFMEKHFVRWYRDIFKFIYKYIKLNKLKDGRDEKILNCICTVLKDEKEIQLIKDTPSFLFMMRKQNKSLTEELDTLVCEKIPRFYENVYRLETTEAPKSDMPTFIKEYLERIEKNNMSQGKNGTFFGHGTRQIATIRNILIQANIKYDRELFGSIVRVVSKTLLESKEGMTEKLDAVSLLTSILVKYPEVQQDEHEIMNTIYENKENIKASELEFISSNIDDIALKIGLQFMFSVTGKNVGTKIMELMPFIRNSVATTISVTGMIKDYLEIKEDLQFTNGIENIVLQNTLQWIYSDNLDVRWNATNILFFLLRNPENEGIINRKLVELINTDNAYIKNLIMQNIYTIYGIDDDTRKYIVEKCSNDANYVVRTVCKNQRDLYEGEEKICIWNE